MNKIFLFVGIVLCAVLLLMGWIFIGEFSGFADTLEEGSEEIALDEKSKFVGDWETSTAQTYMFSISGTGAKSGMQFFWDLVDGRLVINYQEIASSITYDYSFSNDHSMLTLEDSYDEIILTKKTI
jgi:hypothetical protein